jgi:hypothetical protein
LASDTDRPGTQTPLGTYGAQIIRARKRLGLVEAMVGGVLFLGVKVLGKAGQILTNERQDIEGVELHLVIIVPARVKRIPPPVRRSPQRSPRHPLSMSKAGGAIQPTSSLLTRGSEIGQPQSGNADVRGIRLSHGIGLLF